MGTLIDLNVRCADDIHWQGCLKITHWSGELMILISMTASLMALVPGPSSKLPSNLVGDDHSRD